MLTLNTGRARIRAALAGGLFVALLIAGCGGGGDDAASSGGSDATSASSPAELAVPTAAPTPTLILQLDSFQYSAALTLRESKLEGEAKEVVVSTEGSFQAPDRHAFTYTTRIGGGQTAESAVLIGGDAWLRQNDQPYRKTARDDPEVARVLSTAFSSVRPSFLGGEAFAQMREAVRRLTPIAEDVNGLPADRYEVGAEGKEFFRDFLADPVAAGQDLHWQLWLAREGGWPVRLRVTGRLQTDAGVLAKLGLTAPATWELRIDLSRPNDPSVSVQAPQ